jgi:hypothetical protein
MLCDCYFNAVVSIASWSPPIILSKVLLDLMTRILQGFHHERIKMEKGLAVIFIIHPYIKNME